MDYPITPMIGDKFRIAIDFDDTIYKTNFPDIINPLPHALRVIKAMQNHNKFLTILWTCREGKHLNQAIKRLEKDGLYFAAYNENPIGYSDEGFGNSRKIGADIYIEDKDVFSTVNYMNWFWIKTNIEIKTGEKLNI